MVAVHFSLCPIARRLPVGGDGVRVGHKNDTRKVDSHAYWIYPIRLALAFFVYWYSSLFCLILFLFSLSYYLFQFIQPSRRVCSSTTGTSFGGDTHGYRRGEEFPYASLQFVALHCTQLDPSTPRRYPTRIAAEGSSYCCGACGAFTRFVLVKVHSFLRAAARAALVLKFRSCQKSFL